MKIIPAIDLTDGKCVRLFQGDFEQTTEYSDDPAAMAAAARSWDRTANASWSIRFTPYSSATFSAVTPSASV